MVYLKIKRVIDIILSTIGLIILFPVFLALVIAIKIDFLKDTPTHLLENP